MAVGPWALHWKLELVALGIVTALSACAAKSPLLPTGAGVPFPDFAAAYQQATSSCRGVKTMTASMAMSGKAGATKVRGRIDAGFEAPARARLEGIAPFGKPVFVLVADGSSRHAGAAARGSRAARRAAGSDRRGARGRGARARCAAHGDRRLRADRRRAVRRTVVHQRMDVDRAPRWRRLRAEECGSVGSRRVDQADRSPSPTPTTRRAVPSTIRLRAETQGRVSADLTLRLSDVEINIPLDPRTFNAELPEHPVPLTLEELRRAGPLGGGQ